MKVGSAEINSVIVNYMPKIFTSKIFWAVVILFIITKTIYFFTDMKTMSKCGALPGGKKACTEYKCESDNFWTYIPRDDRNKFTFSAPICSDGTEAIEVGSYRD
jgi:hypothetical protein